MKGVMGERRGRASQGSSIMDPWTKTTEVTIECGRWGWGRAEESNGRGNVNVNVQ